MDRITALVTDADHPTGLGAAHALRDAGADTIGLTHHPDRWPCRSRAWSEVVAIGKPSAGAAFDAIVATARRVGGPVFLLPSSDTLVRHLSRERGRLPDNVRTVLPPDPVVELLLEKTRFARWADQHDYPVPRSRVVTSTTELEDAARTIRFPAILKAYVRTAGWHKVSPVEKAIRLQGPGDLSNIPFDLFAAAPSYVLSEWIPGTDDDVLFCLVYLDRNSDVVASFTGRKLLQFPRLTGSTAICIDRPDAELEAMTARLFKEVGCTGLASLEVKRSATDGRYLITEPTVGRPNLQSSAAVLAGVNLHGVAMRDAWGRAYTDLLGRRRRCFWTEERAIFELLTSATGVRVPWWLITREAFFSGRRLGGAYLRLRDPRPFTSMAGHWCRRAVGRLFRRPAPRLSDAAAD
jgi:predicted ATP-grasp superfamily ATP-dependent carboligase